MSRHRQRLLAAALLLFCPGLALGQMAGSPTPGNRSTLVYGGVTTSAPSYTTGTNNVLSLDTAGNLRVNSTAALPTGTNTIGKVDILGNAGATLDATVGAATAPTNGLAVLGVYNSTQPSPSNGQSVAIQLDANGGLRGAPGCTGVINIAQTATTDVHTFTHFGYICSIMLVSATAQSIGIDEGTGTTCETSGTALIGVSSTSSATAQVAVAANGGFSMGAGIPFLKLQTSADHLCVLQSSTGEVAGTITYADLAN